MSQVGLVVRVHGEFARVQLADAIVPVRLRGALKSGPRRFAHVLAVGDRVRLGGQTGSLVVEEVLTRRNRIARVDPGDSSGRREQVLATNLDQLFLVVAPVQPPLNLRALDRLLVLGEVSGLPTSIVLNKIDLLEGGRALPEIYERIGYAVHRVSAATGEGIPELRTRLEGRVTLLAGPSGSGKSSLANAVEPVLKLRVGAVSAASGKGTHTTTHVSWNPLVKGGALLDAPGIRSILPFGLDPVRLGSCFPEFRDLRACHYGDCTHRTEPGCAVLEGLETGAIAATRHDSYLRMRSGLEERPRG